MNFLKLIGSTPIIRLKDLSSKGIIFAKMEYLNPGGSIKDRMAYYIISKAEENGLINENTTIIEATSGNTGISLAMISVIKGYKCIIVMPEGMSKERIKLMKMFKAEVILTPFEKGLKGAMEKVDELAKDIKNVFLPKQFENPLNIEAQENLTGKEILDQLKVKIDAFIAGVGTAGTLMGIGKALKKRYTNIKIIAVEPEASAVISGKPPGIHKIQGIGDGFIPPLLDLNFIDWVETVSDSEAFYMMKYLARKYGIISGISSGANVSAALKAMEKLPKGSNVLTILPDKGERYLSII